MKTAFVTGLILAIVTAPIEAYAQRGHGGGNRGGGWQGGGGGRQGGGTQQRGGGGGFQGGGGRTASNAPASRQTNSVQHQLAASSPAFSHRPTYHGDWYHGDWRGHWVDPWACRPCGWYGGGWGWGWGFGWGFGAGVATVGVVTLGSPWGWGYYSYYNPYWVVPVGGVSYINYSQPIIAAPVVVPALQPAMQTTLPSPSDAASTSSDQEKALSIFESAHSFFKRGEYQLALAQTNRAVALLPNDSLMHEFRGLCLFALQDYGQAAAATYAVLSIGPGWDSATLMSLYPNASVYNEQLRALETYRDENPNAAAARFLLAYHYMLAGHNDKATAELETVVELEPKDQLSAQLLKGLTTPPEIQPPAGPARPPARPVAVESLVGNWRSSRADGSKFELNLSEDNRFSWKATQQDKQQQLSGTYTLADNYLILTASDQNALVGHVALEPGGKLKFKLAGGSPTDPGLTFTR
ncbi:MAG: tetratricopeptide repeat protein [Planctomycetia bacterium]|nr:tetratricopeptide repeat protein [Planctomycetia bacterium]